MQVWPENKLMAHVIWYVRRTNVPYITVVRTLYVNMDEGSCCLSMTRGQQTKILMLQTFEVLTRNPKIPPGNPQDDDATVQVIENRLHASRLHNNSSEPIFAPQLGSFHVQQNGRQPEAKCPHQNCVNFSIELSRKFSSHVQVITNHSNPPTFLQQPEDRIWIKTWTFTTMTNKRSCNLCGIFALSTEKTWTH
jgi:hypothetical protein